MFNVLSKIHINAFHMNPPSRKFTVLRESLHNSRDPVTYRPFERIKSHQSAIYNNY